MLYGINRLETFRFIIKYADCAAFRKIPRLLISRAVLSSCGMRHSDGFAALLPSQLRHITKKPTTRVGFLK